jgi:hypothetical protein
MFDTYWQSDRPQTVYESNSTTITEKRAPTDASVKLLTEMEAAAREKIVNSIRVENTEFKCVIHSWCDYLAVTNKFMVVFQLNGKKIELPLEFSTLKTKEETAHYIWQKVSERIAFEIVNSLDKSFQNLSFVEHQFT